MKDESERKLINLENQSRRDFLKCSAWAGAGVVWMLSGGIPKAFALDAAGKLPEGGSLSGNFHFVQIRDNHIGFNKEAKPETIKKIQNPIYRVNALPSKPPLFLPTG